MSQKEKKKNKDANFLDSIHVVYLLVLWPDISSLLCDIEKVKTKEYKA